MSKYVTPGVYVKQVDVSFIPIPPKDQPVPLSVTYEYYVDSKKPHPYVVGVDDKKVHYSYHMRPNTEDDMERITWRVSGFSILGSKSRFLFQDVPHIEDFICLRRIRERAILIEETLYSEAAMRILYDRGYGQPRSTDERFRRGY